MGRRSIHIGFPWESQKEKDHQKRLDIGGRIILSRVLVTVDGVWIGE
jgi:hypothetical protein